MTFRYYITEGKIQGTNDTSVAEGFADSEDYFVVATKENNWLQPGGKKKVIREVK